jgi:hypothetical protein
LSWSASFVACRRCSGTLSIHPKVVALLAAPVAGTVLLGVAGAAADRDERARAADDLLPAAAAGAFLRTALAARLSSLPYRRYVAAHPRRPPNPPWPGELRQIPPLRRY